MTLQNSLEISENYNIMRINQKQKLKDKLQERFIRALAELMAS